VAAGARPGPAGGAEAERFWWVLVHQLPPRPPRLRVRIWRRLQALGALQLKAAVYLLPDGEEHREQFEWLVREIEAAGAEATLLRAELVAGTSDEECVARFRAATSAEYGALRSELVELGRRRRARRGRDPEEERRRLARLRDWLAEIERRDFFTADGRETVAALLAQLERGGEEDEMRKGSPAGAAEAAALRGRTWTTRAGVYVDRMASAWLVRRFVDPEARFEFVAARTIEAAPGRIRFDTFGGEYTHEGHACTFEVLCRRLRLRAPGLRKLGEIVHALDLEDEKYDHPEIAGVKAALDGIVAATADDGERIERAAVLFDGLLARFAQRR
jgi:hypothetical protein